MPTDMQSQSPLAWQQIFNRLRHEGEGVDVDGMPDAVYIIESPDADDLLNERGEGQSIARALSLAGIQVEYYLAANEETVASAFDLICNHIQSRPDWATAMPWIHLSAHGDSDGLGLTDGSTLYWGLLTKHLRKLHEEIGPVLLPEDFDQAIPKSSLSLSSCGAFKAYTDEVSKDCPVQSVVGSDQDIGWCQSLIGFTTLYYHSITLGRTLTKSVEAMNVAAGAEADSSPIFDFFLRPRVDAAAR